MIEKHQDVLKILDAIHHEGGDARLIGGCVRDFLLHEPISDIDITTTLLPEQILLLPNLKTVATGFEHGTITIVINKICYQVTTLRQDIECNGRKATVKFGTSWEEDAKRRDFTINALSMDRDGKVFDYCGGITDLQEKLVRFIGDPNQRIPEDYLRILRFFRFSGRFSDQFNQEGLEACKFYADKINLLSKERIHEEFFKILSNRKAAKVLQYMHHANVLQQIIPWISRRELELVDKLEGQHHHIDNSLIKLFLLCRDQADITFLREHLLLSNTKLSNLNNFAKYMQAEWNEILYHCADLVTELAVIKNIMLNQTINVGDYINWKQPKLPVSSGDLIELGYNKKTLGLMLKRAATIWITSNFSASKTEIINKIIAL